jgi:serine/threonine protein kinase
MGEVFQAKDQMLGRNVAIKILPEEFTRDADRVARFQRQVSRGGGNTPLWSPDSRELFYHNGDAAMAVPVETEPT